MTSSRACATCSPADPLFGPCLKIQRAERHLKEVKDELSSFISRTPFELIRQDDPATGDLVFRVKISENVPVHLSAPIGDCIHNLRSAFDLMACKFVSLGGGDISKAQFPVCSKPENFETLKKRYLGKAAADAVQLVEKLQPYQGDHNQPLMIIHKLDILDKHRMIIPVGAAHNSVGVDFGKLTGIDSFPKVFFNPADKQFPLQDGMVLYRVLISAEK